MKRDIRHKLGHMNTCDHWLHKL
ncbi:unnamed protein product [Spirodela intermedia]|uniref:Uncharacterized protein n=1 Tax=Spirodela intermedia TaxID=51605 RepID=A0A7I8IX86_SPIIN|nr:unnamed protein product [Spirodela intermedia]CAA6662448.1 unnamed protein product [Spirodela intermedia]CAA6674047.1 unnamed protein product [Spirodela intermedia]